MARRRARPGQPEDVENLPIVFDGDVGPEALGRMLPADTAPEEAWPDERSAFIAEASRPWRPYPFSTDLTRRSRGLWLQQPIFALHRTVERRLSGSDRRMDGIRAAMAVIREVAVQGTFDDGPTWVELVKIAIRAVREQLRDAPPDLVIELAELIVATLEARGSDDRRFTMATYDPASGEVVEESFAYLGYVRDVNDDLRYRATEQAIFVYGALADHDLEEELQGILNRLAEEAIEHGDIGRARQISERQRVMALRINNNIRKLCIDLKANPEAVTWSRDIGQQVEHARGHLDRRVQEQGRIRLALKERMPETSEREVVEEMGDFLAVLEGEDMGLTQLQSTLMRSHDTFRDGQAGAFRMRRRSTAIDPMAVAEAVLDMRGLDLLDAFSAILPTFAPPEEQRIADMDRLLARLVDNFAMLDRAEREPEPIEETSIPIDDGHERNLALEERSLELLKLAIGDRETADLHDIYGVVDTLTDDFVLRQAVGLACAKGFIDHGASLGMDEAVAPDLFANDVMSGANITFRRTA
jgi:hypothetical protein